MISTSSPYGRGLWPILGVPSSPLALCAADAWAAARLRRGCAQGAAQARTARGADVLGSPSTQAAALRTPAHAGALTPLGAARRARLSRAA